MHVLPQNESLVNRQAWRWLKEAKEPPEPWRLHLLKLASWGLENGAKGDWPEQEEYALDDQVSLLFGWKPENAQAFLFSNPDGPDNPQEQESDLLKALKQANSPQQAAALVLNQVWAAQKGRLPVFQTANPD